MKETKPLQKKNTRERKNRPPFSPEAPREAGDVIVGRNAVRELLASGRTIDKILVQKSGDRSGSILMLIREALEQKIPVVDTEKSKLDALSGGIPHQGILAFAAKTEYVSVEDLLEVAKERGEAPFLVLCDGVTDPHNLGAIIRSAECCGAHGVIIPKRRSVGVTAVVAKASAGALEHIKIAKVSNLNATLEFLKEQGVWTYAAEAGGESIYKTDFSGPCAIVLGSEGDGVSQLVKRNCDRVVSIPLYGKINSFNVSAAAAILLSEAAKARHPGE
ncbi:MAG: 23S rRNA (guanosine(2251)-2'-O)-methyltransferase RlmB [Clostridia bacterium]|nr:23S rRNA (guanosine(2251)-2'-O)-methyltransferase RlmB [Clostridia bacterium]